MDARLTNVCLRSVENILETVCGLPVSPGTPQLRSNTGTPADVTGLFGITGAVHATIALHFGHETAGAIAARHTGTDRLTTDTDVSAAIGDLTRLVAAGALALMDQADMYVAPTCVVVGPHHLAATDGWSPPIVVTCETDAGPFTLEVSTAPHAQPMELMSNALNPGVVL